MHARTVLLIVGKYEVQVIFFLIAALAFNKLLLLWGVILFENIPFIAVSTTVAVEL